MSELTEPWADAEDEYEALVHLLIPTAQVRAERTQDGWDALDSKADGFHALAAAAVAAGLVATHDSVHRLWVASEHRACRGGALLELQR